MERSTILIEGSRRLDRWLNRFWLWRWYTLRRVEAERLEAFKRRMAQHERHNSYLCWKAEKQARGQWKIR